MNYSREVFSECWNEIRLHFNSHYGEVGWRQDKICLIVNEDLYEFMDSKGTILFFVGRVEGRLEAYASFIIQKHPHFSNTVYAVNDVVFVNPKYRGGAGKGLLEFAEEELRALGAQVVTLSVKQSVNWGELAYALGYEHTEDLWSKWIGD